VVGLPELSNRVWYNLTMLAETIDNVVGREFRTPFDPAGVVQVLEIEPGYFCDRRTVLVKHVVDHPMGYLAGTIGRYFLEELRPLKSEH
jgi:hypothetical protein